MDRVAGLSQGVKLALGSGVVALAVALALITAVSGQDSNYQYAFTRLTPEDGAASAEALRAAGIPFRLEAAGDAISVPTNKVHDARLLLASQGLPRASGVGFELFDKGDLGVSEFTQRVNLQRAMEGELSRTIASMEKVRSARVHVTMPKRGLMRSEDRGASAAVMLRLEPGRKLDRQELSGIHHLVAAAVPELSPQNVTLVDENGTLLEDEGNVDGVRSTLEAELERRVVAVLEPAVGKGSVVARVTARMNDDNINETRSVYDPAAAVLKSDHVRTEESSTNEESPNNITGAASNQPPTGVGVKNGRTLQKTSKVSDQAHTFDTSGTVTVRKTQTPRLERLSVAIILNQREGADALNEATIRSLTDLARHAVGFDEERGDQLQLTPVPFIPVEPEPMEPAPTSLLPVSTPVAVVGGALTVAAAIVAAALLRRRKAEPTQVAAELVETPTAPALPPGPPEEDPRDEARRLALENPARAAKVIEAWLQLPELPPAATTTPPKEAPRA